MPHPMQHTALKSSNLTSAGYDPESKTLEVLFVNGNRYQYENVAEHHFRNLTSHSSPGSYFHAHIRQAHKATRVDG